MDRAARARARRGDRADPGRARDAEGAGWRPLRPVRAAARVRDHREALGRGRRRCAGRRLTEADVRDALDLRPGRASRPDQGLSRRAGRGLGPEVHAEEGRSVGLRRLAPGRILPSRPPTPESRPMEPARPGPSTSGSHSPRAARRRRGSTSSPAVSSIWSPPAPRAPTSPRRFPTRSPWRPPARRASSGRTSSPGTRSSSMPSSCTRRARTLGCRTLVSRSRAGSSESPPSPRATFRWPLSGSRLAAEPAAEPAVAVPEEPAEHRLQWLFREARAGAARRPGR